MKIFVDFVNAITDYYSTKTLVMIKEHDLTSQSQSEVIEENKDKLKNSVGFQIPVVEEEVFDNKTVIQDTIQEVINELHNNPFDVKIAKRLALLQKMLEKIEEKETDSNWYYNCIEKNMIKNSLNFLS